MKAQRVRARAVSPRHKRGNKVNSKLFTLVVCKSIDTDDEVKNMKSYKTDGIDDSVLHVLNNHTLIFIMIQH